MIKGSPLPERKKIDYRALSSLNSSMIKLFDSDPVKFYEQFKLGKKRKEKNVVSITLGDIVDFYLLECKGDELEFDHRYDEKFALFDGTKKSSQVYILADVLFDVTQDYLDENNKVTVSFSVLFSEAFAKVQAMGKYSGKTSDKALEDFNENGKEYYNSLIDNIGKTVVDISLINKGKSIAKMLLEDSFTEKLFICKDKDCEIVQKLGIEWKYKIASKSIDCKSELDLVRIDHKQKIIQPYDLKTAFDNEMFDYSYMKHGYYIQAAFYSLALQEWAKEEGMEDYYIEPMRFIVADTSSNNRRPLIYKMTMEDLNGGLDGFSSNGYKRKGVHTIVREISWAEENNIWNCGKEAWENGGNVLLNIKYDKE